MSNVKVIAKLTIDLKAMPWETIEDNWVTNRVGFADSLRETIAEITGVEVSEVELRIAGEFFFSQDRAIFELDCSKITVFDLRNCIEQSSIRTLIWSGLNHIDDSEIRISLTYMEDDEEITSHMYNRKKIVTL